MSLEQLLSLDIVIPTCIFQIVNVLSQTRELSHDRYFACHAFILRLACVGSFGRTSSLSKYCEYFIFEVGIEQDIYSFHSILGILLKQDLGHLPQRTIALNHGDERRRRREQQRQIPWNLNNTISVQTFNNSGTLYRRCSKPFARSPLKL